MPDAAIVFQSANRSFLFEQDIKGLLDFEQDYTSGRGEQTVRIGLVHPNRYPWSGPGAGRPDSIGEALDKMARDDVLELSLKSTKTGVLLIGAPVATFSYGKPLAIYGMTSGPHVEKIFGKEVRKVFDHLVKYPLGRDRIAKLGVHADLIDLVIGGRISDQEAAMLTLLSRSDQYPRFPDWVFRW